MSTIVKKIAFLFFVTLLCSYADEVKECCVNVLPKKTEQVLGDNEIKLEANSADYIIADSFLKINGQMAHYKLVPNCNIKNIDFIKFNGIAFTNDKPLASDDIIILECSIPNGSYVVFFTPEYKRIGMLLGSAKIQKITHGGKNLNKCAVVGGATSVPGGAVTGAVVGGAAGGLPYTPGKIQFSIPVHFSIDKKQSFIEIGNVTFNFKSKIPQDINFTSREGRYMFNVFLDKLSKDKKSHVMLSAIDLGFSSYEIDEMFSITFSTHTFFIDKNLNIHVGNQIIHLTSESNINL